MSTASPKKRRLGEILMEAGLLSELQLRAALGEQRKWGGKLGRTLVEMGFVDEQSMVLALSRQLQVPAVDLEKATITPEVLGLLKVDVAERYGVFPIAGDRRHKTIQIATSDPTNMEALQELAFNTGMRIQAAVASENAIDRAIRRHYYGESVTASSTATPQSIGLDELELDGETISHSGSDLATVRSPMGSRPGASAAASAPASATPRSPPPPAPATQEGVRELQARVNELSGQLAELQALVAGQVRAMRGILEVLIEKGVLSREEYLAKIRPAK